MESRRVRERRELLCHWLAVLGFVVMGFVSRWSLANPSNSESFLVVHASLSQDGVLARGILGSGRTHGVSFQTFPKLFLLVVAY